MGRIILLGGVVVFIQFISIIHASRNNRQDWIWIILLFPVLGSLAYTISYIVPDVQRSETVRDTGKKIVEKIQPGREVQRLEKAVQFSDTVENRTKLADEYMRIGMYKEAISQYESCLEGVHEDDWHIHYQLAKAHYKNQTCAEAEELLLKIREESQEYNSKDAVLLLAIVYEEMEDTARALEVYESLLPLYPGEQARCRYALLLLKENETDSAKKHFEEILYNLSISKKFYRKAQKRWGDIAKQKLNEMSAADSSPPS